MTECTLRNRADQPPGAAARGFDHLDLVARRPYVDLFRQQFEPALGAVPAPTHRLLVQIEARVLRNVQNVRKALIDGVSFGTNVDEFGIGRHQFVETVLELAGPRVRSELFAEIVARENKGAAGVLFLAKSKQVGRIAYLGFDLFLAVPEVVVGDDGDDYTALVTAGQFESQAVILEFALLFPAGTIAALTLAGVLPARQTQLFLCKLREVGRQDYAASVAGPVFRIQSGIILRKEGVAGISENTFDKIEVADEAARRQESDLH